MGNLLDLFVFKYNRTDFHELNLDWIISDVKTLAETLANFILLNTIKYADPIEWDITRQYEANTVVIDARTGNAYISTKEVPNGVLVTNTDYWTPIFNYQFAVNNIYEQIAAINEEDSPTATAPRSVGELVWLNGTLVQITAPMIAGDSYVEGSNYVTRTVEEFIRDNIQVLSDAIQALTDRIDVVETNIGTLDDLDTTDKTSIVNAINEVFGNIVYQPDTLNGDSTTNIGLKAGTYNVTENMTINAQLVIPEGAIINVAAGVTLTINSQILAGRYQIFAGDGDIVVNAAKQPFGYPEWFSDDVQKACDVFSKVILAARNYFVDGDLTLNKENFTLCGEVYGKYLGAAYKYPSRIVLNSGSIKIGRTDTITTNQFISNITVENVAISSLSSGDVIGLYGVVRANLRHIYIDTALADVGIHCYMATGSHIEDVYVQSISVDHTFMGFVTSKDLPLSGGKPASVWFRNCTYANTGSPTSTNTYGFYITDGSDIFIDSCETILADYGIAFVSMNTHTNVDFLISNCDFDGCKKRGIYFYGCTSNGAITFTNCYVAMHSSDANTYAIQFNNATIPVILQAMQLLGNGVNTFGIAGTMHGICSAIMRNVTTPVSLTGDNDAMIDYMNNGVLTHYPT